MQYIDDTTGKTVVVGNVDKRIFRMYSAYQTPLTLSETWKRPHTRTISQSFCYETLVCTVSFTD